MPIFTGDPIRDPTSGEWTTELIPYEQIEQSELPGYTAAHPPRPAIPERALKGAPGYRAPGVTQYSNIAMDIAEERREAGIEQSWMPPAPPPKPKKTLAKFTRSFISSQFGGRDPHKYDVAGDELVRFSRMMPKEEGAYYKAIGKVRGDPLTQGEKRELFGIRRQTRQQANTLAKEEQQRRVSMLTKAESRFTFDLGLEQQREAQLREERKLRIREAEVKATAIKEAAARIQISKGTAFTDEQGNRVVPFYDATGRFLGTQPIGRVKPTGAMTENQIYRAVYDTLIDKGKEREISKWYTKYKTHYAKTKSRSEALTLTLADINKIVLPTKITKTSQAVEWLITEHRMSKEEARAWIRTNK